MHGIPAYSFGHNELAFPPCECQQNVSPVFHGNRGSAWQCISVTIMPHMCCWMFPWQYGVLCMIGIFCQGKQCKPVVLCEQ